MFKEARDWDSHGNVSCSYLCKISFLFMVILSKLCCIQKWGTHPVMMAVGVVDGTSEEIFHTLMSLGSSRSE